jgi:uncharacterized repeat protein (TIGR01451 family)
MADSLDTILDPLSIATDQPDYQPGTTATITATNVEVGGSVTFEVQHITNLGADGIAGTADDVLATDLSGTNPPISPWKVVDGGAGDLDGLANGIIVTSWSVNPDAAGQLFLATAISGTSTATTTFTDHAPVAALITGSTDAVFLAETAKLKPFLEVQASPDDNGVQAGFNTDGTLQLDTKLGHSITLGDVPIVTIGSDIYRAFWLDLNEGGNGIDQTITLDSLQLYSSTSDSSATDLNTLNPVYDIDANGDVSALLTGWAPGTAYSDYRILIPDSYFSGLGSGEFIYLYSQFSGSTAGFEDWSLGTANGGGPGGNALISVDKSFTTTPNDPTDLDQSGNGEADHAGQVINYTIDLTNTGDVDLTNPVVTDPFADAGSVSYLGGDDNSDGVLNPGEDWTYTAIHTVTQTEMEAGNDLVNIASAATDQASGDSNSVTTLVDQDPHLTITKDVDQSSLDAPGTLNYTVDVTNDGYVTLTGVDVTDALSPDLAYASGDANLDGQLNIGETWEYTVTHAVTQADIDLGSDIVNVASVTTDQGASGQDDATTTIEQDPSLTITKTVDLSSIDAPGTLNYEVDITNDGNVTLTSVDVTDALSPDLAYVSGDDGNDKLDLGETWVYTGTHAVTQADIDAGSDIVNVASVTTDQGASGQDDATTTIEQDPSLTITKTVDLSSVDAPGTLNYTVDVTNDGNVTLTGVSVTDALSPDFAYASGDANLDGKLNIGETWEYTGTHAVTQADIDLGDTIHNVADATTDQGASGEDTADTTIEQDPHLKIIKSVDLSSIAGPGTLNYTVDVTNDGNVTLTGVAVTDALSPDLAYASGDANLDGKLNIGETWEYTGTHAVTQTDIDAGGTIHNVADVTTDQGASGEATADTTINQHPSLTAVKTILSVTGGTADIAGDVIHYQIVVTNTGNIDLTGITVLDQVESNGSVNLGTPTAPHAGVTIAESDGAPVDDTLGVGETWTYAYDYTVTQADIDHNSLLHWQDVITPTNTALFIIPPGGTGNGALFNPGTDLPATGSGLIDSFVRLHANGTEQGYNSDARPQQFDEDNTAAFDHSIHLEDIPVVKIGTTYYREFHLDLNESNSGTNPQIDLTQLKIFSASTGSLAGYDGTGFNGPSTLLYSLDGAGDTTVRLNDWSTGSGHGDYAIDIPNADFAAVAASNPYIYLYSMFGNADALVGDTNGGFEEWYVTKTDTIQNTATVSSALTLAQSSSAEIDVKNGSSLSITKTVTSVVDTNHNGLTDAGDVINYSIAVQNTGSVDLTGVVLTDQVENHTPSTLTSPTGDTVDTSVLDIGETWTYGYSYAITATDISTNYGNDNIVTNTATVDTDQTHPLSSSVGVDPPVVVDNHFTGTAFHEQQASFWAGHLEAWDGSTANNTKWASLVTSGVLAKPELLQDSLDATPTVDWNKDGVINASDTGLLLGDANGNGVTDAGENTLFVSLTAAKQFIAASDTAADTRLIMMKQLVAAQLNIDNALQTGAQLKEPVDLVNEAIKWLKGDAPFSYTGSTGQVDANHDGVLETQFAATGSISKTHTLVSNLSASTVSQLFVGEGVTGSGIASATTISAIDSVNHTITLSKAATANNATDSLTFTGDYNTGNKAFTLDANGTASGTALTSTLSAWHAMVDVTENPSLTNVNADGEGLKNALMWFNQNHLVISSEGAAVGYSPNASPLNVLDVHANTTDMFWEALHDYGGLLGIA